MKFIPFPHFTPGRAGAVLASLILLAGCAEAPAPAPAPMAMPDAGPPPPPPSGNTSFSEPALPGPPPDARMAYQRNTPPPPGQYQVVEVGGRAPAGRVVLVDVPPPALQEEQVPGRPGPHHVWIAGHWRYRNGNYLWVRGRWEVPPRPRARFVAPHWDERGGSHLFVEGYWQVL
jgi:hypothetical protein